jgi:response regulator NasT
MALREQLEAIGYRVLGPAPDADAAVTLGRCHPVDVGLFDMRMPGRSGLEAALELFDFAPTPVVLLTGFGASDLPDPMPAPPILGVLTKPASLDDLREALVRARDDFRSWQHRNQANSAAVARSRRERALIARAIADGGDRAHDLTAAAAFLRRADQLERSPVQLARQLLAGEA